MKRWEVVVVGPMHLQPDGLVLWHYRRASKARAWARQLNKGVEHLEGLIRYEVRAVVKT